MWVSKFVVFLILVCSVVGCAKVSFNQAELNAVRVACESHGGVNTLFIQVNRVICVDGTDINYHVK